MSDDADVLNWMINENGTLHGGYSLRYGRAGMDAAAQENFDRHVGVTVYA